MKEVVWVFGASASGKETFIKHLLDNNPPELIKHIGWHDKTITACSESLEITGKAVDTLREKILGKVPELLEKADVVLVKWQFVDSVAKRPQRLKELLPGVRHRVIELKVGMNELMKRLPNKAWWHDYGREKEHVTTELHWVSKYLEDLSGEFEIVSINSNKYGNYEFVRGLEET